MNLIPVHQAENHAMAESIRAMLKEIGIEAIIEQSASGGAFSGRMGGAAAPFDPCTILVPEKDAERAKTILLGTE